MLYVLLSFLKAVRWLVVINFCVILSLVEILLICIHTTSFYFHITRKYASLSLHLNEQHYVTTTWTYHFNGLDLLPFVLLLFCSRWGFGYMLGLVSFFSFSFWPCLSYLLFGLGVLSTSFVSSYIIYYLQKEGR